MGSQASVITGTKLPRLTRAFGGPADLELFRACFGRFPDPVIVADGQSNVLFLNESAQTLTGWKATGEGRLICSDILRAILLPMLSLFTLRDLAGVREGNLYWRQEDVQSL